MTLSRALQTRVKTDADSPAFLYVPKGKAVIADNWDLIAEFLKVLDRYRKTPWTEAQPRFVADLTKKNLIDPYKSQAGGYSAVGRMQFPVWKCLGLAWINERRVPEVTEIGRKFIAGKAMDRRKLLSMQVHRYQFWNPTIAPHFSEFQTLPLLSLYKLLQNIDWYVSREEFVLLASRVRNSEDSIEVANLIEEWRAGTDEERARLIAVAQTLSASSHTKSNEGTTYVKVANDLAYIWNFLRLSMYLNISKEAISIPVKHRRKVRALIEASYSAEIIDYSTPQDWLARYGAVPEKRDWETPWAKASDAREYYQRIGRIDAAAEALTREDTGISRKRVDEYRRVQVLERVLEDILEHNLEELEQGLKLVGRQFSTAVGPIDLLAQDQNGAYVVIELKRGRTGDRVIGQVARYLGWVTERMARGNKKKVRAIVVGREYDAGFASAITQFGNISPYTYDIRVRFDRWAGEARPRRRGRRAR